MASKIINLDIRENIIDFTTDYILKSDKNTALISGGRRPFLFIRRRLALECKKSFFPPKFFTNDEFIEGVVFDNSELVKISDFESAFIIFEIVKKEALLFFKDKTSFALFIDWSFEILSFIEQLDMEDICDEKLKTVKTNAEIGYDVPESINDLLKNIFRIRKNFHDILDDALKTTKGYSFLKAALMDAESLSGNFDEIILIAPFYLRKTEIEIFKKIYKIGKLVLLTQGNPKDYEMLTRIYSEFGEPLPVGVKNVKNNCKLNVYSAFDDQSQGSLLKNLTKDYSKEEMDKTVIIVPDSKMLQSVVSEISIVTDRYNVSMGYPAMKTAVFSLLNAVIEAQLSRKGQYYYSKDIMKVLSNPLLKNMRFFGESSISRIVAHKVEEFLNRDSRSCISGRIFVSFEEIVNEKQLLDEMSLTITKAWKYVAPKKIVNILKKIFHDFFISWENIGTFNDLSGVLFNFLEKIHFLSSASSYPLNIDAMELLLYLANELKFCGVSNAKFHNEEVLDIFKKLIRNKRIALLGSPLKGIQILGLLESRNLFFENVFIVGMTDSAIPALRKEYSLIPKDIMFILGIEISKMEFEIQKYHFNRLIAGAKNLNLIYPDNEKDERSRFIESIIWDKQLESKDINAVKINRFVLPKFSIRQHEKRKYFKTKEIKEYLKNMSYTYSKIDAYLNCKLKFYFMYVLLLNDSMKVGRELFSSDIGNFVHNFLKSALYENLNFEKVKSSEFEKEYFKKFEKSFDASSHFKFREEAFMMKEVLMHRMKKVLYYEKKRSYKTIYACERKYASDIETDSGVVYGLNCRIDRIDTDDKNYMIFDYKTGAVADSIVSKKYFDLLSDGFDRQNMKKAVKSLQLPLYKYIFEKETGLAVSGCAIYGVKKAEIIEFPKEEEIYDKCISVVKKILDDINTCESFEFDSEDKVNCGTCRYFYICR
ncbi:MAG: PD-(D/E)XK nuclease family protein [Endomicrobium sp.]|jgi:CRISPR/Cas system-associated exonuclease Cas4 (RecB family)|nr:PD-(D/E)XK nuclease family protein [Endomicrobium sp.]